MPRYFLSPAAQLLHALFFCFFLTQIPSYTVNRDKYRKVWKNRYRLSWRFGTDLGNGSFIKTFMADLWNVAESSGEFPVNGLFVKPLFSLLEGLYCPRSLWMSMSQHTDGIFIQAILNTVSVRLKLEQRINLPTFQLFLNIFVNEMRQNSQKVLYEILKAQVDICK